MQNRQRAIVIHSPHAGRAAQLSAALTLLERAGLEIVNSISIAELDNLPPQGAIWQKSGIDMAIAAGGDGLVGVSVHADRERWVKLVDVMTALPDRARQAVEIVERHLSSPAPEEEDTRRHIKAVK